MPARPAMTTHPDPAARAALERALTSLAPRDRELLGSRLDRLVRGNLAGVVWEGLSRDVERARERLAAREAARPRPNFAQSLPVVDCRAEIAAAIAAHPVVVVCGETGSGKSTQLPQICLDLGRGTRGLIGHTQPRRIAARTLAARIADELGSSVGGAVGYQVRFDDETGPDTYVKLMTDGILLEEIRGDRRLLAYDTLIIDEAHERSLNIDLVLGYLRGLLPRRPDLRVIVTSATIDPERFARFFGGAPVIEVSGRGYPIEVRWRPPDPDEADADAVAPVVAAVGEALADGPGDVLVFLPTERAIREVGERLRRVRGTVDVLPLYGRIDVAAQRRVFAPHERRRVVLATNVAETAVTVPGIRYVVDTGLARIARYSPRAKVERLPVEPIARAAAEQRKGRCGRVAPGVCIRLYAETDYLGRPEHTEPEILRSNLAHVCLRLLALGMDDIDRFPFIDPPDVRQVNDGYRLLVEIGALDAGRRLTRLGRELAGLPLDPRVARLLLAARDGRALAEVLIIAAALSVPDPRERPLERQSQADAAHARWADPRSDFLWYLNLWRALAADGFSAGALRRASRRGFLSVQRLRDWRDAHDQLAAIATDRGWRANPQPADYAAIHRALLTGLLGQIAQLQDDGTYLGPRGLRLRLHPGSALAARPPPWIVAAEFTETTRVFARTAGKVGARWIADLGRHLVVRSVDDAQWDRASGRVLATERVSLYGLVLVGGRRVDYAQYDRAAAHAIFIREALVPADLDTDAGWHRHNTARLAELRALERRARRHDLVAPDERLADFYALRIPAHIASLRELDAWRAGAEQAQPQVLYLGPADVRRPGSQVDPRDYPETLDAGGVAVPLRYRDAPGEPDDGITALVPLAALNRLPAAVPEWLVPGHLPEKIEALLRGLPKDLRRALVPIGERVQACRTALAAAPGGELHAALAAAIAADCGARLAPADFAQVSLPAHLRMHFEVIDAHGEVVGRGDDLRALQDALGQRAVASFGSEGKWAIERAGIRTWDFGTLPGAVSGELRGQAVHGHAALVDEGDSVRLAVVDTDTAARALTVGGLRRLARLALPEQMKFLRRRLRALDRLQLAYAAVGPGASLADDVLDAALDRTCLAAPETLRDPAAFQARIDAGRAGLAAVVDELAGAARAVLDAWRPVHARTRSLPAGALRADLEVQLEGLVYPGFIAATPPERLARLPRYLQAIAVRLDKLRADPARDAARLAGLAPLRDRWRARADWRAPLDPGWRAFRWQLEELRILLFAEALGAQGPVSVTRLERALAALQG